MKLIGNSTCSKKDYSDRVTLIHFRGLSRASFLRSKGLISHEALFQLLLKAKSNSKGFTLENENEKKSKIIEEDLMRFGYEIDRILSCCTKTNT